MSNAQNSHGQSLTVPFYPMEKSTTTESSRQVPVVLQPSTTSIQIFESFEHEFNVSVQSILNKMTPDNIPSLTKSFKALPIDTIERLEKTIDLVFEKAIAEQSFAPLCSILCSAMQSVQVRSKDGKTVSFKKLIISKCQSLFELDKAQEIDSAKKLTEINSSKDPEKMKELQLEFEENERLHKRSVGNCRFVGELFKQKILTPNIMLYCIMNLVTKHVEEPLECLCILLKTVGKELEQSYDLNDTFNKLTALTSSDMKSKISSRIQFMIQDVIDLRRDKWISEKQDRLRHGEYKSRRGNENEWNVVQNNTKYKQQNYTIDQSKLQGFKEYTSVTTLGPPKWSFTTNKNMTFTSSNPYAVLNDDKKSSNSPQIMSNKNTSRKPVISESEERQRMMSGVASVMPQFAQPTPSINSSSSSQPKEAVEEPGSVLDSEMANKIKYHGYRKPDMLYHA